MKKFITVCLCFVVMITASVLLFACNPNEKTVNLLEVSYNEKVSEHGILDLGDFVYTENPSSVADYPNLNLLIFKAIYNDNSQESISLQDVTLEEISYDGNKLTQLPEVFGLGHWSLTYKYKEITATVQFNMVYSTQSANYLLQGMPANSWTYSQLPKNLHNSISILNYPETVVFNTDNINMEGCNAELYYVTVSDYEETAAEFTSGSDEFMYALLNKSSFYFDSYGVNGYYIDVGDYYLFAKMAASGSNKEQLTDFVNFTVSKERLNMGQQNITAEYQYVNQIGSIKLSETEIIFSGMPATIKNLDGVDVYIDRLGWANADETAWASDIAFTKNYRFGIAEYYQKNYDASNLVAPVSLTVKKGYIDPRVEISGTGSHIVEKDLELNQYPENKFEYFTAYESYFDDEGFNSTVNYFSMIVVKDRGGKVLPVVDETTGTVIISGDSGASAKIYRRDRIAGDDGIKFYIAPNNTVTVGEYIYTVNLADKSNYVWKDYLTTDEGGYGNNSIELKYNVNPNPSHPNVDQSTSSSIDKDGYFIIKLSISKDAYSEECLTSLNIKNRNSYSTESGHTTYTTTGLSIDTGTAIQVTDGGEGGQQDHIILIKVKLICPPPVSATDFNSLTLCFSINMNVAEGYEDVVNYINYVIFDRYNINARDEQYDFVNLPQYMFSITTVDGQTAQVDCNSDNLTFEVDGSKTVGEVFSGLTDGNVEWRLKIGDNVYLESDHVLNEIGTTSITAVGTPKAGLNHFIGQVEINFTLTLASAG